MVHLLSCRHPPPCPTHQSTRLTSALHRTNNKIIILMNSWHRSTKNTSEEASMRRTPPLQHNPSLAPRAYVTPLHTFPAFTDNRFWPLTTKEILTNSILTTTTKYLPPPTLMRYAAFLSPFSEHNHTSALIHVHHSSNPTFNSFKPLFFTSDIILRSFQAS